MIYYINGWRESKSYFLSFGFTLEELKQMEAGKTLRKGNNVFWIELN